MLDEVLRQDSRIPTEEQDGLKRIGSGNNRIVFRAVDNRYADVPQGAVVKRAYPYAEENKREVAVWNAVHNTEYEAYFMPVLASAPDAFWIVMPFGEPVDNVSDNRVTVIRNQFGGQDVGLDDFGWYEDGVRCYDYGSCDKP